MGLVTLKNGKQEAEALVTIVMMSLNKLLKERPMSVYELVMKCRDNNHQFFGDTAKDLLNLALLQKDLSVHSSIRNIILSAVEGEGLNMIFKSPISKENKEENQNDTW